jgi:hypothetical protein
MTEKIILHNVTGVRRHSGTDQDGCRWIEFYMDDLADLEDGECVICGGPLSSGWMCRDGGEEICDDHVGFAKNDEE